MYYEDIEVGERLRMGAITLSVEDIISFAQKYDPQPFHLSEEAGRKSLFGGLVASGWHIAAEIHRLSIETISTKDTGSLGSPGLGELRWLKPIPPNVEHTLYWEIVSKRLSKSKPGVGILMVRHELFDDQGEMAVSIDSTAMVKVRATWPGEVY